MTHGVDPFAGNRPPYRVGPEIPPRARRRSGDRPVLHLGLLFVTFLTLSWTGGLFWEGLIENARSWGDLLHPSALTEAIVTGLPYGLWTVLILGAHELGHYFACRYYRIPATLPFFIPGPPIVVGTFGALIRIRGRIPHRRALFDVAAAGPLAGFAIAAPVLLVGYLTAETSTATPGEAGMWLGSPLILSLFERWLPADEVTVANQLIGAGWVGMLVTSLNLFPVGQLDGGHATYAVSRRLHRALAYLTLIALGGSMLYQIVVLGQLPAYLLWFVILVWMRDRHPPLLDEQSPLGAGRIVIYVLLLVILALALIPVPLTFIDG